MTNLETKLDIIWLAEKNKFRKGCSCTCYELVGSFKILSETDDFEKTNAIDLLNKIAEVLPKGYGLEVHYWSYAIPLRFYNYFEITYHRVYDE